jgi:hypothetical protein
MGKLLLKYTRFTEYEIEVDENESIGNWDKILEKNPDKYVIDSWLTLDDHVRL